MWTRCADANARPKSRARRLNTAKRGPNSVAIAPALYAGQNNRNENLAVIFSAASVPRTSAPCSTSATMVRHSAAHKAVTNQDLLVPRIRTASRIGASDDLDRK